MNLRGQRVHRQRGISLVESLVALLILALGILGLAGTQARMLVENRIANQRAIAIGLIDTLAHSMAINPDAARAGNYTLAWGAILVPVTCQLTPCTPAAFAQQDLFQWRNFIAQNLPNGDARVFTSASDTQQIGIAIAWQANEGKAASDSKYTAPFNVTTQTHGVQCPANKICQLVYVRP
jgi:type IV pilus assembly protein PilV